MANWSNINIKVSGTHKQITAAILYIDKYIDDSYLTYDDRSMIINSFDLDTTTHTIHIQGEGRWSGSSALFMDIAELFNCHVDYKEKESGTNFTVWVEGSGSGVNYKEDTYYSQLYIDMYGLEEFQEEVGNWICEYNLLSNLSIFKLLRANGMSKSDIRNWLTNN